MAEEDDRQHLHPDERADPRTGPDEGEALAERLEDPLLRELRLRREPDEERE